MAGFDFYVRCCESHRPYLRELLRFAQHLTKNYNLKLRYSWQPGKYHVQVDGPLTAMQASLEDIPQYMRGFATGHRNPANLRDRMRICERFLSGYVNGVWEMTEAVADVAARINGIPFSYVFNVGEKTHLSRTMNDFTTALILAHNNRLSGPQLLEAAHTSLELLMKSALGLMDESFGTLINTCVEAGLISPEYASDLLMLKDYRKNAKHRGQGIKMEKAWQLTATAIEASHQLLAVIRQQDRGRRTFPSKMRGASSE